MTDHTPAAIGRLCTAMITPFRADGAVDLDATAELARALVASGTESIVATGSTGEAATLNDEETVEVWRAIKTAVGGDVAVVAGATNNDTARSIALSQEAERLALDAVLLTVPAYNKPTQAGLIAHFSAIADATSLPGMLYNVPSRTALNMTAETTLELAAHPRICGIKEASGDLAQIAAIIDGAPRGFRVWSGNDGDTLPVLSLGGHGVVSVAGHLVGAQIREMISACVAGSNETAAGLHYRLTPLIDALFCESNPTPLKFALNEVGFPVGDPRMPLLPATEAARATIRAALARTEVDLPVPAKI
jgi:4-hydroxy-tetrahydrodipicolinate synthase